METIKMTYKQIGGFEFNQAIAKIENTPTTTQKASHIRQLVKRVKLAKEKLHEEYKSDVVEAFSVKGPDGKPIYSEQAMGGFEMDDARGEEFQKALESFEKKEAEIDWRPLTLETLSDIKLTAKELDMLGDLVSEDAGPGVPNLQSIR